MEYVFTFRGSFLGGFLGGFQVWFAGVLLVDVVAVASTRAAAEVAPKAVERSLLLRHVDDGCADGVNRQVDMTACEEIILSGHRCELPLVLIRI